MMILSIRALAAVLSRKSGNNQRKNPKGRTRDQRGTMTLMMILVVARRRKMMDLIRIISLRNKGEGLRRNPREGRIKDPHGMTISMNLWAMMTKNTGLLRRVKERPLPNQRGENLSSSRVNMSHPYPRINSITDQNHKTEGNQDNNKKTIITMPNNNSVKVNHDSSNKDHKNSVMLTTVKTDPST